MLQNTAGHSFLTRDAQAELEDLGEVVIPEGPPDKFIFAITLA